MHPFEPVFTRARHGGLFLSVPAEVKAYWASPAFVERTDYFRNEAQSDKLRILHHMLDRFALNPASRTATLQDLATGTVSLDFFQLSSPVGAVELEPGSQELADLAAAVMQNFDGPRVRAVLRWQQWQTPQKQHKREKFYAKLRALKRESLPWAPRSSWGETSESGRYVDNNSYNELNEYERAVKDLRQTRLHSLLSPATLHGSYYQFLEELALQLLTPETNPTIH